MPNDLFVWEAAGGLVHHCPQCFKPLNRPGTRTQCLGHHVEWCKRYHRQLFKKGTSHTCNPCAAGDKEQEKRHREIAEKLRELKETKELEQPNGAILTPKALNAVGNHHTPSKDSPTTKKERKALKKSQKNFEKQPEAVSTAEVNFVTKVLRPHDAEAEDVDLERKLLDDPDIKLNRAYHPGTSNRRDIRNEFVKKDKHGGKSTERHVDTKYIDSLLQVLDVSPLSSSSKPKERELHRELRDCIERDLEQAAREREELMMRKAGFWRWASKKAYKRLVNNGRIWGQKKTDGASTSTMSMSSASGSAFDDETDDTTEPDTDITTPSDEEGANGLAVGGLALEADAHPSSPKTPTVSNPKGDADDGWKTVGKPSKPMPAPVGTLKLVHNGGLAKMASPVTPARQRPGFAVLYE